MKKPALRENRFVRKPFKETEWTMSSKTAGEYIFRRLSIDQSDKKLNTIRPKHQLSKLIVSSNEIDLYINDYLMMLENRKKLFESPKTDQIVLNGSALENTNLTLN